MAPMSFQDKPAGGKRRRRPWVLGLSFFVIGLVILLTTLLNRKPEGNMLVSADAEFLVPAASTSFGDLAPLTVEHAKVRMLAPKGWTVAPNTGLANKGRGMLALLPETGEKFEQGELPILYVYNYNEFPIHDSARSSLYEEGMTVMEWATALATDSTFSDAQKPEELPDGVVMFDATIQGYSCICGVSLTNGPMLLYFQMPAEWVAANARELEYIHKDLADITFSLEAL